MIFSENSVPAWFWSTKDGLIRGCEEETRGSSVWAGVQEYIGRIRSLPSGLWNTGVDQRRCKTCAVSSLEHVPLMLGSPYNSLEQTNGFMLVFWLYKSWRCIQEVSPHLYLTQYKGNSQRQVSGLKLENHKCHTRFSSFPLIWVDHFPSWDIWEKQKVCSVHAWMITKDVSFKKAETVKCQHQHDNSMTGSVFKVEKTKQSVWIVTWQKNKPWGWNDMKTLLKDTSAENPWDHLELHKSSLWASFHLISFK